jgi:hypothetical protein
MLGPDFGCRHVQEVAHEVEPKPTRLLAAMKDFGQQCRNPRSLVHLFARTLDHLPSRC